MRFCGIGDPLFNKLIGNFIEIASSSNVVERTEIISNGLLLSDEHISIFAKHLGRIVISVEGLSDEDYKNFALRNIKFLSLVEKIEKLYKYKDRICTVHVKIHNQAVLSEERKKKFFEIFGPISDEIYIENLVDLWPEKKSNLGVDAGHRFERKAPQNSKVCPQIFKSMQINADGRVVPCCVDWRSINIVGDIKEKSLSQIWQGESIKELQKKHLMGRRFEFSPCQGCNHNEYSENDNLDANAAEIFKKITEQA